MKPRAKIFTKDSPCTKLDIWRCFRVASGFRRVPVVEAQSLIGMNAPRGMEREGRLVRVTVGFIEYYELTDEGEDWLHRGFRAYLKNHPAKVASAKHLPASWGYGNSGGLRGRVRRVRISP